MDSYKVFLAKNKKKKRVQFPSTNFLGDFRVVNNGMDRGIDCLDTK